MSKDGRGGKSGNMKGERIIQGWRGGKSPMMKAGETCKDVGGGNFNDGGGGAKDGRRGRSPGMEGVGNT